MQKKQPCDSPGKPLDGLNRVNDHVSLRWTAIARHSLKSRLLRSIMHKTQPCELPRSLCKRSNRATQPGSLLTAWIVLTLTFHSAGLLSRQNLKSRLLRNIMHKTQPCDLPRSLLTAIFHIQLPEFGYMYIIIVTRFQFYSWNTELEDSELEDHERSLNDTWRFFYFLLLTLIHTFLYFWKSRPDD